MINKNDISIRWYSGTGGGGQHRNRTKNCCEVTHTPTGIQVNGTSSRKRSENYKAAVETLSKKLEILNRETDAERVNEMRVAAVANGTVRTYNFITNTVRDHRSDKVESLKRFLNAKVDLLKFSMK